jgi:hypothetical protein
MTVKFFIGFLVEKESTETLRRKFSVSFLSSSENSAMPTTGVENDLSRKIL